MSGRPNGPEQGPQWPLRSGTVETTSRSKRRDDQCAWNWANTSYSQDGHDIGTIKHLIVDPATNHVKTVVVEKGIFLHDDTEIALDALQIRRQPGRRRADLCASYTAEQVKALPRFDMAQYTPAPAAYRRGKHRLFLPAACCGRAGTWRSRSPGLPLQWARASCP